MRRRTFIKYIGLGSLYSFSPTLLFEGKSHILTLSFDDGFKKSFYRTAEIYEEYGLQACLNIIASGHLPSFKGVDAWILPELMGNFDDWNALKSRGHEIMPHTWEHLNLTKVPVEKAKENIDRCLEYFEKNLEGYTNEDAIYNFAFNASTPELEDYALEKVKAIRSAGWILLRDRKHHLMETGLKRLGCWSYGPDFCDQQVEQEIADFLNTPGGWLILNVHGLDGEGWGPLNSSYLDGLLKRLTRIDHLGIIPAGQVIKEFKL